MTPRTKTTAVALTGALVLASGAYALGSQAGDGEALAGGKTPTTARPAGHPGGPHDLSGMAGRLGVTEDKLRAALEDLRADRGAKKDQLLNAFAKALASELDLDAAKVTAALEKFRGERKVVRRDRRGDRLERFDEALAAKLGVDAAKIRSAFASRKPGGPDRRAGKASLADLAKEIGVSEDKLRAALADLRPGPRPGRRGFGHGVRRGGGPAHHAELAKELGVTPARLRDAFQKIRGDLAKRHQAERDAFIAKLADRLGISAAKVEDVIDSRPHHGRRGP
jgi:Mn-dependent DtxR family transcriptional regulator